MGRLSGERSSREGNDDLIFADNLILEVVLGFENGHPIVIEGELGLVSETTFGEARGIDGGEEEIKGEGDIGKEGTDLFDKGDGIGAPDIIQFLTMTTSLGVK